MLLWFLANNRLFLEQRIKILSATHFISSSSGISNGFVQKDGQPLFEKTVPQGAAFLLSVYQHFGFSYPKFYKMDNLAKLGWLAAEILLKDNFKRENYQAERLGLVLANKNSSLDDDIKYWESVKSIASPSLFVYTLPNIVIGEICIRNGFKGEHTFYIQEKFDANFIVQQVDYLLDNDILDACICGWVDFLETDFKAVLYLVERKATGSVLDFDADHIEAIFNAATQVKNKLRGI